jgi:hypothetical protein
MSTFVEERIAEGLAYAPLRSHYEQLQQHDGTCKSLDEVWLPSQGGVVCPSDLMDCMDCGLTFFNEGLGWGFPERDWICECCSRRLHG